MSEKRVSIVVPVYNAGPYIDRAAPSLLNQSIGADAYEVIYVNDGSTDDSADRLERLAAEHPHVRVHHQENSGWPGKPRNVGVALAKGEYVQFVDQDDELGLEALERMYALAARNDSDIVLGKLAGTMIGPRRVYRRTIERGSVTDSGAIETLTSHKMFKREFLLRYDIRYPEGYWRAEDLLFVVRAYARAGVVSVLGDYPCYYWNRRDDGGNNSTAPFDLAGHYERLRVIVDAAKTAEPETELQDRLLRRLYEVEVMSRVSEPSVLNAAEQSVQEAYSHCRAMAVECFPPRIREGMSAIPKLRATLLEQAGLDDVRELARRVRDIRSGVEVEEIEWRDGKLHLRLEVTTRWRGDVLALVKKEHGYALEPRFTDGIPGADQVVVQEPASEAFADVAVKVDEGNVWWWANADLAPSLEPLGDGRHHVVLRGEAVLDPSSLAGGAPLPLGLHGVSLSVRMHGLLRVSRLRIGPRRLPNGLSVNGPVIASATSEGPGKHVHLRVQPAARRLARHLAHHGVAARSRLLPLGDQVRLPVRLAGAHLPTSSRIELPVRPIRAELVAENDGAGHLSIERRVPLGSGRHRISFGKDAPVVTLLVLRSRVLWAVGHQHRGLLRFLTK